MTFQPIVPFDGISGKIFLQRTREVQQAAFVESPRIERNTSAFLERIGSIGNAEELVADRQLLEVALGAFGLDEDINNKFFIEKILSSDPSDDNSLANKLSDKRYLEFSKAFGFGDSLSVDRNDQNFAEKIVKSYQDRQFEISIGEKNQNMRIILGFERDLSDIISRNELSNDAKWFSVMAAPPLRKVFETALGLPASFGALDLDRQLSEFRERSDAFFDSPEVSDFAESDKIRDLENLFLARSQINSNFNTSGSTNSVALQILRNL